MKYVDGFVGVVQEKNVEAYREMAAEGGKMWMKYGALEYIESVGEDLNPEVPEGMEEMKGITFPALAGTKPGETVIFSFIVFKSRQHRDEVNARVYEEMNKMADKFKDQPMPFDMKRMAYGGFNVIVEH